jgi:hypothetical protein
MTDEERGPEIALRQVAAGNGATEYWSIGWEVQNRGTKALKLLSARLPHGQFKSEELRFEPALELPPDGREKFEISVHCYEPTGFVTENAFVIFHAIWSGGSWRIFARIRVEVDSGGVPEVATESITTQKVGFSGISS